MKRHNAPYGEMARAYRNIGFTPIPIGQNDKRPTVAGFHGREASNMTAFDLKRLTRAHSRDNVAIVLPPGLIGIDVDAHSGKAGAETFEKLEDELGFLPPTYVSSARRDGLSGIRLYRIPPDYSDLEWPGRAGPGIDIITWYIRYVNCWPSWHSGVGGLYRWFLQTAEGWQPIEIPDPALIPELPLKWCEHLGQLSTATDADWTVDTAGWLGEHGQGKPCNQMAATVKLHAGYIREAALGGLHDAANIATYAIAGDMAAGHTGGLEALDEIRVLFTDSVATRERRRKSEAIEEWNRSLNGAVAKKAGKAGSGDDPCLEAIDLGKITPVRITGMLRPYSSLRRVKLSHLWYGRLAFEAISILDGDPSQGKSLITLDTIARATRGWPMPLEEEAMSGPINVIIFAPEDPAESVILPRLQAVDADMSRIFKPDLQVKQTKRGVKVPSLSFPDAAHIFRDMIREVDAGIIIVDPITAFLGEKVHENNTASLRQALTPLQIMLQDTHCCAFMTRHFNKNTEMSALYRGGGSTAYSAAARYGMVTAWLPDGAEGEFGICAVKANNMPPAFKKKTITGRIIDSDIELDDAGTMVPRIEWLGIVEMDANTLIGAGKKRSGPEPFAQLEVRELLEELFGQKETWPSNKIREELAGIGHKIDSMTVKKVKADMGIRSRPNRHPGMPVDTKTPYVWTVRHEKSRLG